MPSRPLFLCYHAVSADWPDQLAVDPPRLERQLALLVRLGFRGATATEALNVGGRLLHVTFDDAFRSVATALPVLERLRLPATIFVCTDFADTGAPLDIPELRGELERHPDELRTMGWDELRELCARGVAVGSHTKTHAHLRELSDEELARELADSRTRCEDVLGRSCRLLAYPFGEHDERVRAVARHAGYEAAFALAARPGDRFAVPRVDLYRRDGRVTAALKISPLRGPLRRAADLAGLRRGRRRAGPTR